MAVPPVIRSTHKPMVPNGGDSRRRAIIGVVSAVVIVGAVIWFVVARKHGEPRLNESTTVLARFVASKDFEAMPFEKQRLYYKVLDDRDNEIDQAFKEGNLSEPEYRNSLEAAWLGKHINRVEKYMSLPPGNARTNYIHQLLEKKAKKDAKDGKQEPELIRTDETAAELRAESWPSGMREQWNVFHNAYRQEKKSREEAATRPAGR